MKSFLRHLVPLSILFFLDPVFGGVLDTMGEQGALFALSGSHSVYGDYHGQLEVRPAGSDWSVIRVIEYDSFRFDGFKVQEISLSVMTAALEIKAKYRLSYWDCAILAAARALGCNELYSEDMAHGREIEGIKIINPFR